MLSSHPLGEVEKGGLYLNAEAISTNSENFFFFFAPDFYNPNEGRPCLLVLHILIGTNFIKSYKLIT